MPTDTDELPSDAERGSFKPKGSPPDEQKVEPAHKRQLQEDEDSQGQPDRTEDTGTHRIKPKGPQNKTEEPTPIQVIRQ